MGIDKVRLVGSMRIDESGTWSESFMEVVVSELELPVVVVGAGPIGLAAAAHLVERGLPVLVCEAGENAGTSVRQWHQVRLFSRWAEVIDPAAERLLVASGWSRPDLEAYPTGREWAEQYLQPLAEVLGHRFAFDTRVVGVARRGRDRVVDAGRDAEPLTVHVLTPEGERLVTARALIDASGTWSSPNPLGGDGLPALGEKAAGARISYQVPDLSDARVRARYAGRRIAVAGSGHSALTALVAFAQLAEEEPGTHVDWLLRRDEVGSTFGGGDADQLPARGVLGKRAAAAVAAGHITTQTGFRTSRVESLDGGVVIEALDGRSLDPVEQVVALTGFRPELSWLSEIRLDLDPTLQAPRALAPLIDPNVHSCGTVYPHGAAELTQPEQGVFLVGMKSYGRAPTFLAMTGYEQVRSVVAWLAGDYEAARRVELVLPETGVCGGAGVFDEPSLSGEGCCAPSIEPVGAAVGVGGRQGR